MSANYDAASGGGIQPGIPHDLTHVIAGKIEGGGKQVTLGGKSFDAKFSESQSKMFAPAQYEKNFFSPDNVFLTISDNSSEKLVRVALKSQDVAAFLGVEESQVEKYVSQGNLEELLTIQSRKRQAEESLSTGKPPVNTPLETLEAVSAEVREATIGKLDRYELTEKEYEQICGWYELNKASLFDVGVNRHLTSDLTGLPRTVIFIADGPHKGLHVRSKVTVGTGSYNKAVRALHIDSGKGKVARGAKEEHAPQREIDSNAEYAALDPVGNYFATGAAVKHKGSWKNRRAIAHTLYKGALPANISHQTRNIRKETNVDKVTFIMDEVTGGELADGFYQSIESRERTSIDYMIILLQLNSGLSIAHKAGKVDVDYKAENVFMDGNVPKMADFGMAYNTGDVLNEIRGTPGFLSPEILVAESSPVTIQPGNQMWIQGCMMAIMFRGMDFDQWNEQVSGNRNKVCNQSALKKAIEKYFPDCVKEGSLDWCIAQCLAFKPEDRISAKELQPHLENHLQIMITELAGEYLQAIASLKGDEDSPPVEIESKKLQDILTEITKEIEESPDLQDKELQEIVKRLSSRKVSSFSISEYSELAHDFNEMYERLELLMT